MKKEVEIEGWRRFIEACQKIKGFENFDVFLDLVLTPEEKAALSARVMIFKGLLENKMTQRDLSKKIEVSIAKITRGSNALKRADPEELDLLKNLLKDGDADLIFQELKDRESQKKE